jgi:uncharacterized membrane protein
VPDRPLTPVAAPVSGYIRFIDTRRLLAIAASTRLYVRVLRRVGHFVPAGVQLFAVSRADRLSEEVHDRLLACFDIGPVRTLQQDAEFGLVQIADIALKAISPAVNDPSTAINCLDQLGRIMIRWIARDPPDAALYDPPHVVRVAIPWIDLDGLLDTGFEQIRHYAEGDLPVSLRMLRVLQDMASTTDDAEIRARLRMRGDRVFEGCRGRLDAVALERLRQRLAALHAAL